MMKLFQLINAWRNYDDMKEGIKKIKKKKTERKNPKVGKKKRKNNAFINMSSVW